MGILIIKNLFRKNNINNNLHWNNYIPYKEIPKNLEMMDILIMPYVSSITTAGDVGDITNFTSPLKLFDYLRVGKIIICSDIIVLSGGIKTRIPMPYLLKIIKNHIRG